MTNYTEIVQKTFEKRKYLKNSWGIERKPQNEEMKNSERREKEKCYFGKIGPRS
jgi:hypothetical protein